MDTLRKLGELFRNSGELTAGQGRVSGIVALALAIRCLRRDDMPNGFVKQQMFPFTYRGDGQ